MTCPTCDTIPVETLSFQQYNFLLFPFSTTRFLFNAPRNIKQPQSTETILNLMSSSSLGSDTAQRLLHAQLRHFCRRPSSSSSYSTSWVWVRLTSTTTWSSSIGLAAVISHGQSSASLCPGKEDPSRSGHSPFHDDDHDSQPAPGADGRYLPCGSFLSVSDSSSSSSSNSIVPRTSEQK